MARRTFSSPSQRFPGINKINFWEQISSKQGGIFPWKTEEIKEEFPIILQHISFKSNWDEEQLANIACFILDHINKYSSESSSQTRIFSIATEEDEQPERSSTPKPLRTCDNCDDKLEDKNISHLCQTCQSIFKN